MISSGSAGSPSILEKISKKGSRMTSSYGEEWLAFELALDWIEANTPTSVCVVTDSQSLCQAIQGVGPDLDQLRLRLRNSPSLIFIQWVPGHSNIPGNEVADEEAKKAADSEGTFHPVLLKSAFNFCRKSSRDPPSANKTVREVYQHISKSKDSLVSNRRDQTLLAKVRAGSSSIYRSSLNIVDPNEDPLCPRCEIGAPHTLVHVFKECDGTLAERYESFGPQDCNSLGALSKYPLETVALAKEFFNIKEDDLGAGAPPRQ